MTVYGYAGHLIKGRAVMFKYDVPRLMANAMGFLENSIVPPSILADLIWEQWKADVKKYGWVKEQQKAIVTDKRLKGRV